MINSIRLLNNKIRSKLMSIEKVYYGKIEKVDMLIFWDEGSKEMINNWIAKDLNLTTAVFQIGHINLNQRILYLFIKNLKYYKLHKKTSLRLFRIYLLSHIQSYDPKYAITFFDNRHIFYEMSYLCEGIRFYSIQNGCHAYNTFYNKKSWIENNDLATYFCMGDYQNQVFNNSANNTRKFLPVGSLKASIHKALNKQTLGEFDICFVSQYRDDFWFGDSNPHTHLKKIFINYHKFLKRYVNEEKVSIIIAMFGGRKGRNNSELEYMKNFFGNTVTLLPKEGYSTYLAMESSKVVVTHSSTSAFEALGWGQKVLFIADEIFRVYYQTGDDNVKLFDDGVWLLTDINYASFKNRVDELLTMSDHEYKQQTLQVADLVMKYDPKISTYKKIQMELEKHL